MALRLAQNPPGHYPDPIQGHAPGDWNSMALVQLAAAKQRKARYLLQVITPSGFVSHHAEFNTEAGLDKAIRNLDAKALWRVIDVATDRLIGWETTLNKPKPLGIVAVARHR